MAIKLLDSMSQRWPRAIPCRYVLSHLLDDIIEQPQDRGAIPASTRASAQPDNRGEMRETPVNTPQNAKFPSANSSHSQHRRKRTRLSTRRGAYLDGLHPGLEATSSSLPADGGTRPDVVNTPVGGAEGTGHQSIPDTTMTPPHSDQSMAWQHQQATTSVPAAPQEWSDLESFVPMEAFTDTSHLDDIYLDTMGWDSLQSLVTDLDWSM